MATHRTWMRRAAWLAIGAAGVAASLLLYQEGLRRTGNFHAVIDGQLYRSAQPRPEWLREWVGEHGIRSIVNLRGARPGSSWYDGEVRMAEELSVRHVDFAMSAEEPFTPQRADELLALMTALPKPILVHCYTGADRTGLVSMIYAYRLGGIDEETAEEQLGIRYGHVGLPFVSPAFAMDWSWETLEPVFGIEGS